MKAQFNTVSFPCNRYKVAVENPAKSTNEKEATPESVTSKTLKSVSDKSSLPSTDKNKKEQIARYLSVCYPLSSIKINSLYDHQKATFSGKLKFHNGLDLHVRNARVYVRW